jgi:hypothetical protein
LPPPPQSPQNRSAFSSSDARTRRPSAVDELDRREVVARPAEALVSGSRSRRRA